MARQRKPANEPPARLRSDAQRNKDDILAAAVLAFAKDANAPLEAIAKAAGVGIGTLYRHYPTREALLEAAYRKEIKKLCDAAPELLEKNPPDVALARFLDRFIDHMEAKRGMVDAIRALFAAGGTPMNESLAMVRAAVAPIIEAGKAQGVLREDVSVDDFIAVKGAVATTRPANARRLAVILVDGLRYRGSGSGARAATKRTRRGSR
jgi:AcrR family transcriptional regulator